MTMIAGTTSAQNTQTEEIKELEKAVESLRVAMVQADKDKLLHLTADDLTYGHSGGLIENKTEFIEKIVSGQSDFVSIDLSSQTITLEDNTAIVRHILSAATNDSGKPGNVQLHVMTVWHKYGSSWKMLARQAVKSMP